MSKAYRKHRRVIGRSRRRVRKWTGVWLSREKLCLNIDPELDIEFGRVRRLRKETRRYKYKENRDEFADT